MTGCNGKLRQENKRCYEYLNLTFAAKQTKRIRATTDLFGTSCIINDTILPQA